MNSVSSDLLRMEVEGLEDDELLSDLNETNDWKTLRRHFYFFKDYYIILKIIDHLVFGPMLWEPSRYFQRNF